MDLFLEMFCVLRVLKLRKLSFSMDWSCAVLCLIVLSYVKSDIIIESLSLRFVLQTLQVSTWEMYVLSVFFKYIFVFPERQVFFSPCNRACWTCGWCHWTPKINVILVQLCTVQGPSNIQRLNQTYIPTTYIQASMEEVKFRRAFGMRRIFMRLNSFYYH